MVKIIGILAIVLIYSCEINAEISNYQQGKVTIGTKKPVASNVTLKARPMLTTEFPEPVDVGGTLMKHVINVYEALMNHFQRRAVQNRRTETIRTDEEINQIEKNESETSKPKKKMKHHKHSAKLKSNITEEKDFVDKKHQMDKKGNIEKKHTGKKHKHKHHKNTSTEKNMGIGEEKENDDKTQTKETTNKLKELYNKENKQVDNSKDDMRIPKLLGESLPSSKYIKPGTITKKVQTPTSTQSKAVREGVVDKTMYKRKHSLRAHKNKNGENIRHRQQPMSGEGGEGGESGHEDDHGGGGGGGGRPKQVYEAHENTNYPSILSPYAIHEQMEGLMQDFPDVNATVTKFARTVEYNDLILITVTDKKGSERYSRAKDSKYIDDAPEKKIIFIVHGLTVMGMKSMTSLVQMSQLKLLFSYYFKYLDKFDFYIMPLANPDGYSASRSFGRPVWNKNVSPQSECPGVFVDRNFDIGWNASRVMSSCSQTYPGPTPFSEVESKAVRDVFHYFSHKILAYIHVHSGTYDEKVFKGDAILYPRGYTESQSDDDKYIDLKGEIDEAMKNASFRVISVSMDTLANWYGVVSGSSVDYAASVFGIPYALEFVMQIYDPESLNNNALTQIWSRLIDTTLNNMWKSLHHASEERRLH